MLTQKQPYNTTKKEIRLIFFGTPEFALPFLEKLINSDFRPITVITAPDKPVGRKQIITPPLVKVLAQKHKIPVLQPEKLKDPAFIEKIRKLKPDLIVVAAYGKILPKEILALPVYGCLNIHPSLLPKYRGPSPIQSAILNAEKETGITIFKMNEKMDEGSILVQKSITIEPEETVITLRQKLSKIGANLLISFLEKWLNKALVLRPQNHQRASYTKILTKQDAKIFWNKTAKEIDRQIRALMSWPGTFCFLPNGKKLKIIKARPAVQIKSVSQRTYGKVILTQNNELAVQTSQGILIIQQLQVEGKKQMTSQEFLNGYPHIVGKVLR